jgi:hypothetical protein
MLACFEERAGKNYRSPTPHTNAQKKEVSFGKKRNDDKTR